MSYSFPRKTGIVLLFAAAVGIILFMVAPDDITPGIYQARLTIDSPTIRVDEEYNVTVLHEGPDHYQTVHYVGDGTNATIVARDELQILPGSRFSFVITAQGTPLQAGQILVQITNEAGYNQSLRTTRQSEQTFYVELQPLVQSRYAVMILAVVAILWFTEGISLVATSLLIPVMIVMSEIHSPRVVLASFFDPAVALILGGFLIGRALSKYELDKRLALLILFRGPGSGSSLLLTVMGVTAFLSMWISNTASAAIMIPIALAVISRIRNSGVRDQYAKALVLGVAYSATVGGVGSLVGSPPNPLAASYINSFLGIQFSFISWLPFGFPVLLIMLPVVWRWLIYRFKLPKDIEEMQELKLVSEKELLRLGPMTAQQRLVVAVFIAVVALWLTEELPDFISVVVGWTGHGISSSIVALIGGVTLMVLRLLDERDVSREVGWSSILILGSGIALGGAMIDTGVSAFLAYQMGALGLFPPLIVILIVGVIAVMLTMVASNTGAAVILIPIAIPLAASLGIDPLLLTMVIAIAVSMDFALPTGTPPSTIAYSTGELELGEMIRTGLVIDFIAIVVVSIAAVSLWAFLGLVVL
ncbi:MAG: DASS family sodium-coupled anion symporter [Candidatus Thorarchaeota archaeon]|nr:MAG: DASS family sodium-coupled anion symporter [Candidatus Thorarchaeota archaeon]